MLKKISLANLRIFALQMRAFKFVNEHTRWDVEGQAEKTSPRGDRTETGLRTKPSAEQLQSGAYDLLLSHSDALVGSWIQVSSSKAVVQQ